MSFEKTIAYLDIRASPKQQHAVSSRNIVKSQRTAAPHTCVTPLIAGQPEQVALLQSGDEMGQRGAATRRRVLPGVYVAISHTQTRSPLVCLLGLFLRSLYFELLT